MVCDPDNELERRGACRDVRRNVSHALYGLLFFDEAGAFKTAWRQMDGGYGDYVSILRVFRDRAAGTAFL